jgi:hypothetical protein
VYSQDVFLRKAILKDKAFYLQQELMSAILADVEVCKLQRFQRQMIELGLFFLASKAVKV